MILQRPRYLFGHYHLCGGAWLASCLLLSLSVLASAGGSPAERKSALQAPAAKPPAQARFVETYGKLPLSFEVNQGQTDPQVKFLSRGHGHSLFLTPTEAVFVLQRPSAESKVQSQKLKGETGGSSLVPRHWSLQGAVLHLKLLGANPAPAIAGLDELPGRSNYFIGNDPKKWRTNVPNYAKVKYEGVYPGIDLVYYGSQRQLEYDFVVAPGADPKAIQIAFDGLVGEDVYGPPDAREHHKGAPLQIDAQGDLVLQAEGGELRFHKPVVYQPAIDHGQRTTDDGPSVHVDGRYVLTASNQLHFSLGPYDHSKPLVIDPVLSYATYLGGSDYDDPSGIAVDSDGNAYVVGSTYSVDFPIAGPSSALQGLSDVFVTKLNAAGSDLVCSGYIGGSGDDYGRGIALDSLGNIYVTGGTASYDFPITSGVVKDTLTGYNAFVTKIDSSCSSLVYSTFLGGSQTWWGSGGSDSGASIAVDSFGNAYVSGSTYSIDFPITEGAYDTTCGTDGQCDPSPDPHLDLFVTKLDTTASSLLYSTYLGGSSNDSASSLAVDSFGNIYVTGVTLSEDFPTTPNAFDPTYNSGPPCANFACEYDSFFAKIDPFQAGGASLVYSTYIGGSASDMTTGLAVDASGIAYIAGFTASIDFPTTSNALQRVAPAKNCETSVHWCADAVVMKIDPTKDGAASLLYSTYLGGTQDEGAVAIALDATGNIYVTGRTYSDDFPLASPTQATLGGGTCDYSGMSAPCFDAFVTKLNASGSAVIFSTFLGGNKNEEWYYGGSIAVDPSGNAYVTGDTAGSGFPTTPGAFQTSTPDTCANFPTGYVPFVQTYGVFGDSAGNTLFLGQMTPESYSTLTGLPLPTVPNQKYCDWVRVAPTDSSYYMVPLYVPTAAERTGDFSWFQNQIYDPVTGDPLPGNVIPSGRIPDLMGWRVAPDKGGGDAFVAKFSGLALPVVLLSPTSLNFGDQALGTISPTQPVRVQNTGDAALVISSATVTGDFQLGNECSGNVDPGRSCILAVQFAPAAPGTRTGQVTINSNALGTPTVAVSLTGNGVGPTISLSAATLTFAAQRVGTTSSAQAITLTNNGNADLSITSVVTDANFLQTNTCGSSVAAGVSCTFSVTFTPRAPGSASGVLAITDNALGSPHLIALSGTGTGPTATLSVASLSFGSQRVGTSSAATPVTLSNSGNDTLTIAGVSVSANFTQTNTCGATLAAGASCTVSVTFTPTSAGSINGTLLIADNAPGSPQAVALSGTGTGPAVTFSANSISFSPQSVGTSSGAQTVTLTNSGTATLNISAITTTIDFTQSNGCGTSLGAGASCTINVSFAPTARGVRNGALTVIDDAPGSPQTVALSGSGLAPVVALSATSVNFPGNPINLDCPSRDITVSNTGEGTLLVSSIQVSGPFTGTDTCVGTSVAPGASCAIRVKFYPPSVGAFSGTLTITDNAVDSPQTVALTGKGTPFCALLTSAQTQAVVRGTEAADFTISDRKPSCSPVPIDLTCAVSGPATCAFSAARIPPSGSTELRVGNLRAVGADPLSVLVTGRSEFRVSSVSVTVRVSDFKMTQYPTTATVMAGGTARYSLTLAPTNGLTGSVRLSCSGAPAGATCTMSPQTLRLDGVTPVQTTVTVSTTARSMAFRDPGSRPSPPRMGGWTPHAVPLLVLLALAMLAALAVARQRRGVGLVLAATLLLALVWAACGGGGGYVSVSGSSGTPAGTYSLTVTATYTAASGPSSNLSHTTTLTLTVN